MQNLIRLVAWFPFWWYLEKPEWFLRFAKNLVIHLDRQLAVSLMVRLWLTPLFGDPNFVGRVIAFAFRTVRIVLGVLLILAAEALLLVSFSAWLSLPFFFLTRYYLYSLVFVFLVFFWFVKIYADVPGKKLTAKNDLDGDPRNFLRPSLAGYIFDHLGSAELLVRIIGRRVNREILTKLGYLSTAEFLAAAGKKIHPIETVPVEALLKEALALAFELKDQYLASPHLLLAMLKRIDFKYEDAYEALLWSNREYDRAHPPAVWDEDYISLGLGGFNRSWTGRVTPDLDRYSRDLTQEAQRGRLPLLIGKEKPLAEALRVLERSGKSSVLLVGSPGCGKTTLVYGIASEIVKGTKSQGLADKRLVMLDLSKLQAGCRSTGEIQDRLERVLDDLEASGNIIIFLDEIHNAVVAGGGVDTSIVFATLEPRIGVGGYQLIGATSWDNYRKYIEPNEAFSRLFERVEIPEASVNETLKILEFLSESLERQNKVVITLDCLKASIDLSRRFIYEKVLPDKAIDLLEETVTEVRSRGRAGALVLKEDVEKIVSEKTQIPVTTVTPQESASLLNLEERIHTRLVNQTEAVLAVANAIRRARVGLRDEKRPITSLLFVGPTGVGKTETAKVLAEVFYGSEERLIRFDMSEFQTDASVESMIAKLTDAVRHKPYSLILFDEAEKAHRRLLDIFLAVVDDGRLTDVTGHTVSFANSILIFTSNAGTSLIFERSRQGKNVDEFRDEFLKQLEAGFRIELLNRFDGIIIYKPLAPEHVAMIARFKLGRLSGDLAKQGYQVNFNEDLIQRLAKDGYDVALGARPLRRLIQDKVEATLARKVLAGEINKETSLSVDASILT